MTVRIAAISTQLVPITFEVKQGGMAIDPEGQDVWLAFMPQGNVPDDADWVVGEWAGDGGLEHEAFALASGLTAGKYDIWGRVDWGTESFRGPAGKLMVT